MDEDRLLDAVSPGIPQSTSTPFGTLSAKTTSDIQRIDPTSTVPVSQPVGRPVGRPPALPAVNAPQTTVLPVPMTDSYIPDLNPPHNCQVSSLTAFIRSH
jgi:hypothetical protein